MATPIKLRRVEVGFTQLTVCQRSNISTGRYSCIERGIVRPRPDEIERLAFVLDMNPDDLFPERAAWW
jgi:transcriptional regulator with XRE-family HTH domain